jgi:DNA repair exonuclease SbcCD ATPase subunit
MRLKKVEIENFRLHTHSVLDFDDAKFIVIRGKNMAGKSSIAQAISMTLTPSTDGLDPRGAGYADKIKTNQQKAVISADVQGKSHLVRRTVTMSQTNRTPKSECLDDPEWNPYPFEKQLENNRPALSVAINTDLFISMDEKEQKKLLAQLVLPSRYDFPQDKISAVNKALGEGVINFAGEPFEIIEKSYKKLFDERAVCNRQVKDFVIPDPLPVASGIDSQALEAKMNAAKEEKRKLDERRNAAITSAREAAANKAKLQTRVQNHQERVDQVTAEYRRAEAEILSDPRLKAAQQLAAMKPSLDKLTQESTALGEEVKRLKVAVDRIEALPEAGSTCPTCDQIVSPEKLTAMAQELGVKFGHAKKKYDETLQQMKALGDVEGSVTAIDKHNRAVEERSRLQGILSEKTKLLKDDTEQLEKLNGVTDNSGSFDEPLRKLEEQIEVILSQLRPVIAAEERRVEIELRNKQLAALQAKAASLNDLVSYFDKDGIKASLLKEYIGGFESKINETMRVWGYSCALSVEPYEFKVTGARGGTLPVKELCGAEKVMFSLALQCAVSRTAGVGFVVIDEVAMFLPELRPKLNEKLFEMVSEGHLEQVILLVADTSEAVPPLPNAAFFMVEDGITRKLKRAA